MSDGIIPGDWIEWPGPAGQQRGQVGRVGPDAYDVLIGLGGSWVTIQVPKGERVRKIEPPPGEE